MSRRQARKNKKASVRRFRSREGLRGRGRIVTDADSKRQGGRLYQRGLADMGDPTTTTTL